MRLATSVWLIVLFPAALVAAPQDGPPGCCGGCCGRVVQGAPAEGDATPATSAAMQAGPMGMTDAEHGNVFDLLTGHAAIERKVEEVPGGVKTTTTTTDPALVETLRVHVRQMTRHLEEDRPVRIWDPVFREVFAHSAEITLTSKEIEGGIEVTETSDDTAAIAAIRAHASKVNAFVSGGHAAARPPWAGRGRGRGMQGR